MRLCRTFDDIEIKNFFEDDVEVEEDNFDIDEELKKPCISKVGDIWTLGKYKIICGYSTLPETYQKLLGDKKINLVCTGPPYFVNLESTSGKISNDDLNDADGYKFLMSAFKNFHSAVTKIFLLSATVKK